jgi:Flp pilus assembly protein TadG
MNLGQRAVKGAREAASDRSSASGQVLIIAVGGLVALIAVVALIIDGGNAYANQRIVQNGSDAAAEAGAIVMAERLAGAVTPVGGWDLAVQSAINSSAAANGISVTASYYTDICGIPLKPTGTASLNGDDSYNFTTAALVGSGMPTALNVTPDCPSTTAGPPAGVIVLAHKDVGTFFAAAIGIPTVGVSTQSTAASGYLQNSCDATQGAACALLPVTFPVYQLTCTGSNQSNPITDGSGNRVDWVVGSYYKVPLCGGNPGSVGWLDWTPPSGGTQELIQSIQTPNNPAIPLPSWQYVTQTGNTNSQQVENAVRAYDGQIVLIPEFDLTCNPPNGTNPDSSSPAVNTSPNYGCPAGSLGGNGQNQWYRFPSFASFQLCISTDPNCTGMGANYGAYINGNNHAVCDTGNGATSCLVGKFVDIIRSGTIGAGFGGGQGGEKQIGIQLIK